MYGSIKELTELAKGVRSDMEDNIRYRDENN